MPVIVIPCYSPIIWTDLVATPSLVSIVDQALPVVVTQFIYRGFLWVPEQIILCRSSGFLIVAINGIGFKISSPMLSYIKNHILNDAFGDTEHVPISHPQSGANGE